MSRLSRPGPVGIHNAEPLAQPLMSHMVPPKTSSPQRMMTNHPSAEEPTFLGALKDPEFWRGYGESVLEVGKSAGYMMVGEASVYAGWVLGKLPGGALAGRYMMVDGASTYLGAMCNVSKVFHGPAAQCIADDFVGEAYRSASEIYTGDASYGDVARASVSIAAVIRGNTIPILLEKYKGSALNQWVTVRGYETSNAVLLTADGLSVLDGARVIESNASAKE